MKKRNCIGRILSLLFVGLLSWTSLDAQKVTTIEILNADLTMGDDELGNGAQRLLGNVIFRHEDATMSCDSAYYYPRTASLDAFSNVDIVQGDTLFLYGDKLHYEGLTKIAKFRNNVKMIDDSTVLVTDFMDYDRVTGIANYFNGGVITEGQNRLTSERGYYNTQSEVFTFRDSVVVTNPDYTIYSDTLDYHTTSAITYFDGPTEIIGKDNYIYCENGWYDTDRDISLVNTHALLKNEGKVLLGDTLYYERGNGFGRATSNVRMIDSLQQVILQGNLGLYYENEDRAMLTDSALMIQIDGADSLFIHADTLRSIPDTASVDQSVLLAYYKVKIYRYDIQGMCDSLAYHESDSIFHMFGSPVLWSDENQLTASKIELETRNQQIYKLQMRNIALLISREDSVKYNQIRGKNMTGHFKNNELVRLDVTGNGQTIYYAEDRGEIIGVNKAECSDLIIYLEDNRVKNVNYLVKPTGKYYPLSMFPPGDRYLDGFSWNEEWRPQKFSDVFIWK